MEAGQHDRTSTHRMLMLVRVTLFALSRLAVRGRLDDPSRPLRVQDRLIVTNAIQLFPHGHQAWLAALLECSAFSGVCSLIAAEEVDRHAALQTALAQLESPRTRLARETRAAAVTTVSAMRSSSLTREEYERRVATEEARICDDRVEAAHRRRLLRAREIVHRRRAESAEATCRQAAAATARVAAAQRQLLGIDETTMTEPTPRTPLTRTVVPKLALPVSQPSITPSRHLIDARTIDIIDAGEDSSDEHNAFEHGDEGDDQDSAAEPSGRLSMLVPADSAHLSEYESDSPDASSVNFLLTPRHARAMSAVTAELDPCLDAIDAIHQLESPPTLLFKPTALIDLASGRRPQTTEHRASSMPRPIPGADEERIATHRVMMMAARTPRTFSTQTDSPRLTQTARARALAQGIAIARLPAATNTTHTQRTTPTLATLTPATYTFDAVTDAYFATQQQHAAGKVARLHSGLDAARLT